MIRRKIRNGVGFNPRSEIVKLSPTSRPQYGKHLNDSSAPREIVVCISDVHEPVRPEPGYYMDGNIGQ